MAMKLLTSGNEIINKGTLNVSGTNSLGLITDAATATGALNLTGVITANKAVTQNEVNVNSGSLDVSAAINAGTFNNNGATEVTTGSITASTITNRSGTLTSSASNLVGAVENKAVLNLTGGATQGAITNYNSTNGTINVSDDLTVAHAVSDNLLNLDGAKTLVITGGSLTLSGFTNDTVGSAITMAQGTHDTVSLGAVTLGANLNTSIDAFLGDTTPNSDNFTARSDSSSIYTKTTVADSVLKSRLGLNGTTLAVTNAEGVTGTYVAKYLAEEGALVFAKTVHNLVSSARNEYGFEDASRTFTLSANEDIASDIEAIGTSSYSTDSIGAMSNTTSFTIDGTSANKYKINGNNKGGIEVGSTQTLTMQNLGDVYGFTGNAVDNAGTLNVSNSKFTSGIKNINTLKFTGSNTIDGAITDNSTTAGTTTVESGTTTFNGTVTQNEFVNKGTTYIDADDLVITATADNLGTLNLRAGDLASNIGQTTATGITNIVGVVTNDNDHTITQNSVTISDGSSLTTKANLVTSTSAIANAGTLNLAGGELASAISGAGTTNITADVTSSKVVEQNIFTTTSGKKYTNSGTLTVNNTLTDGK